LRKHLKPEEGQTSLPMASVSPHALFFLIAVTDGQNVMLATV